MNTYTTANQARPHVAMAADGDFVITWQSHLQDGSGGGIYAQRYNASGVAQGSEFQVNSYTTGAQANPSIAMDSDGDFVITWTSDGQDGSGYGVYAQRYNASGTAQGSEFRVNTSTTGTQWEPSVSMDADGDFVVAWSGQDGSYYGVYSQRYNSSGVAQGSEFQVNEYTTSSQFVPYAAMDADGDFVITWASDGQDGGGHGVYAQRFNASGATLDGEFRVNTHTTDSQTTPSIATDAYGAFVIVWASDGQDGDEWGVYAQRWG